MRIWTVAIVGALAVAVSLPAAAAQRTYTLNRSVATYEACETKAHALGMPHGQVGHAEYVRECMGGRPGNANTLGAGSRPSR
jgi:hypothetical protein